MAKKRIKKRIEKKRVAIQARRVYHNLRRADVVYTYGIRIIRRPRNGWPRECDTVVFTERPLIRDAIPVRVIDAIRVRENTRWSYEGETIAAWNARSRKYKALERLYLTREGIGRPRPH